jgi:hypothetical protein
VSAADLEAAAAGERLELDGATVTIMNSPLCGRYRLDRDDSMAVRFTSDAQRALDIIEEWLASRMPDRIELRCHRLNRAARRCYDLRNAASGDAAADFEAVGDVYFGRSLALLAEWED